jgi:UDP-hydrolysing UDP-N-acetyl-D-glucosamine 2-epimerase
MTKIAIYVGSRANYSSAKPMMNEIKRRPNLNLQVIVGAAAVISRYGLVSDLIKQDGFEVTASANTLIEGESPLAMSQSVGMGTIQLSNILDHLQPDFVLAIGDRFDVLSWVISAAMMNIPIAHTMGGERSGTIDESIRHAITKFSNIHFPASADAYERLIKMGEEDNTVHLTGCPRIDYVKQSLTDMQCNTNKHSGYDLFKDFRGVGTPFNTRSENFLLVSFHPVTTEYGLNGQAVDELLGALNELQYRVIMLWPNSDAGSGEVSKRIRVFRETHNPAWLNLFVNLPIDIYNDLMDRCLCLVGNSSSAIREAEYIGTPVVNIGSRQNLRQIGGNVINVDANKKKILVALKKQIKHGKYDSQFVYGDGNASSRIIDVIESVNIKATQKLNSY